MKNIFFIKLKTLRGYNNEMKLEIILSFIKKISFYIFRAGILLGLAFIIIYPIIVKLSTSFKVESDLYDPTVFMIPKNPTLHNYTMVMDFIKFNDAIFNSLLYGLMCAVFQTLSCTLVAYGIARFKFKGRNIIFVLTLLTLVIPPQAILLPLFIQFQNFNFLAILNFTKIPAGLNLINTAWPMLLMSATSIGFKNGLYIYMLRQYFINMPKVLEEAAYIDGCGPYRTFAKIMLPGALPLMATVFLFTFVWQWNDVYYSEILMPGINLLSTSIRSVGYNIMCYLQDPFNNLYQSIFNNTGMFLLMGPLIILYVFTQKLLVQSIESSGIVG